MSLVVLLVSDPQGEHCSPKQYNFLYHLFSKHVKCIVYEIISFLEALSNSLIAFCPSSHPLFQLDHFLLICFPFHITWILPLPFNPPTQWPSFHTTLHSVDILSCILIYESLELETMAECENVPFCLSESALSH